MHDPKQCRSCGAQIYWAKTEAGKSMPVDAEPVPDGNVILFDRRGSVLALVLHRGEVPPPGAKLRQAHFRTCPNSADWRAAKRARGT